MISGETFIKSKMEYEYSYLGDDFKVWEYDPKLPIKLSSKVVPNITVKWLSSYSGQFELKCGDYTKTIVVESLFK